MNWIPTCRNFQLRRCHLSPTTFQCNCNDQYFLLLWSFQQNLGVSFVFMKDRDPGVMGLFETFNFSWTNFSENYSRVVEEGEVSSGSVFSSSPSLSVWMTFFFSLSAKAVILLILAIHMKEHLLALCWLAGHTRGVWELPSTHGQVGNGDCTSWQTAVVLRNPLPPGELWYLSQNGGKSDG